MVLATPFKYTIKETEECAPLYHADEDRIGIRDAILFSVKASSSGPAYKKFFDLEGSQIAELNPEDNEVDLFDLWEDS